MTFHESKNDATRYSASEVDNAIMRLTYEEPLLKYDVIELSSSFRLSRRWPKIPRR
jgi:hypothetical protein